MRKEIYNLYRNRIILGNKRNLNYLKGDDVNMRCPYCEGKMRKGQLHAVGAGQDWSGKKALRVCG